MESAEEGAWKVPEKAGGDEIGGWLLASIQKVGGDEQGCSRMLLKLFLYSCFT